MCLIDFDMKNPPRKKSNESGKWQHCPAVVVTTVGYNPNMVVFLLQPLYCNAVHYSVVAFFSRERTKCLCTYTHPSLYQLHLARLCWKPFNSAGVSLCSTNRVFFLFFFFNILTKQHCTVVADLLAFMMQISPSHCRSAKCASLDGDLVSAGALWVQWRSVQTNTLRPLKHFIRRCCSVALNTWLCWAAALG